MRTTDRRHNRSSRSRRRGRRSTFVGLGLIAASTVVVAGRAAAGPVPPDDGLSVSDDLPRTPQAPGSLQARSSAPRPIEVEWLAAGSGPVPDDLDAAVPTVPTEPTEPTEPDDGGSADARSGTGDLTATPPTAAGGTTPVPWDELISNHGCTMVPSDPGDHLGVNCIDEGWLNTDGTVYVHTTVPATVTVYLSSNPDVIGYGYNGFPIHADSQTAASGEDIQEFTSEPFEILAAHTYFITAYAIDGDGLSWRYGTATVPHTAVVVVDNITVLNDGDEYSWNDGEISFDVGVDDELLRSTAENSYDDGDTYNPAVSHPVEGSPASVDVWATATEDDPGKCVVEATYDVDDFQDGGGCHFAKAFERFELAGADTTFDIEFSSPHEHLRIRVEGDITLWIP